MRIVIATGGTGGHIFPALQTGLVLKERGHEVIFMGSFAKVEEKVKSCGFEAIIINAQGLNNRSVKGLFGFASSMYTALGQARSILKKLHPDKVIGFGGYGSFAAVLSARLLNIPTMIHEQNVIPGKANRLLAKLVKKIAVSFLQTNRYLDPKKAVWTGCPCHQNKSTESKEVLLKKFSLDPKRRTILVLGGSQGSQRLNEDFFEMISSWKGEPLVQAIHMTGPREYAKYIAKYKNSAASVKVAEFIDPIEEAYAVADVVLARSGAATVSELGFFAIPSVLVPYPLADGHQRYNAEVLADLGIAKIIEQKDLNIGLLKEAISFFLELNFNRELWKKNAKDVFKELPALELAKAVEGL